MKRKSAIRAGLTPKRDSFQFRGDLIKRLNSRSFRRCLAAETGTEIIWRKRQLRSKDISCELEKKAEVLRQNETAIPGDKFGAKIGSKEKAHSSWKRFRMGLGMELNLSFFLMAGSSVW